MEEGDRSIDRILITTDLNVDVFCIRHDVVHPCFLGRVKPQKISDPFTCIAKQGRTEGW